MVYVKYDLSRHANAHTRIDTAELPVYDVCRACAKRINFHLNVRARTRGIFRHPLLPMFDPSGIPDAYGIQKAKLEGSRDPVGILYC